MKTKLLDLRIAMQKLDDAVSTAIKAVDALMDNIEEPVGHQDNGRPRTPSELWKWAEARGMGTEDWKGCVLGCGLKGTKNLTAAQFDDLSAAIHSAVRGLQRDEQ